MNNFEKEIESLESNLIGVINELKASTEVILRELTLYLSASARDISGIKDTSSDSSSILKHINSYIEKLDFIENKIIELPAVFINIERKIQESSDEATGVANKFYQANTKNLKQVVSLLSKKMDEAIRGIHEQKGEIIELKRNFKVLSDSICEYKEESNKGQERFMIIIDNLMKSLNDSERAEIDLVRTSMGVQEKKIDSDTKIRENRIKLWIKVIGLLSTSGGLLYLLVNFIIGLV